MNIKNCYYLLLIFALSSCSENPSEHIEKINGYWEIEHVQMADGSKKEYNYSEQYDYYDIDGKTGIRKKVTPLLNGKYLSTDVAENVKLVIDKKKLYMEFSTFYTKWKEEVVKLNDNKLEIKNTEGNTFFYKRPKPFKIE